MSLTNPAGQKKNKVVDLATLALVTAILGLTPVFVGMGHVIPAKGPDKNPSILIIFLILLGAITIVSIVGAGATLMGTTKAKETKDTLTPYGLNLLNILSKLVAGLFLISGFVKLQDPIGFGYKLDDYWIFFSNKASWFPAELMKDFSVPIAGFVSVVEVALGFALITGYKMRLTAWLLLLMLLFFTVLTGLAAFTGELQDCGCFGDALKLEPWQTFGKDLLLLIPGIVIFVHQRRIHPYYRSPLPGFATIGTLVAGTVISIYCYMNLELMDFRGAYKVGQDICYNSTNAGEDGEIYAHDFTELGADCGMNGCEGPMLYIIMYDMESHPLEHYNAAGALATEILEKAPGIKVAGGTSTGSSVRKKMDLKFPADFCWSGQDQKALRTMIRSSPGFIFLQDGVVQKKWHYNNMPDVEELRALAGAAADVAPTPPVVPSDTIGFDSIQH
jgi:uncharacterized membrane protein YphA (DoxX/SURF4 family)